MKQSQTMKNKLPSNTDHVLARLLVQKYSGLKEDELISDKNNLIDQFVENRDLHGKAAKILEIHPVQLVQQLKDYKVSSMTKEQNDWLKLFMVQFLQNCDTVPDDFMFRCFQFLKLKSVPCDIDEVRKKFYKASKSEEVQELLNKRQLKIPRQKRSGMMFAAFQENQGLIQDFLESQQQSQKLVGRHLQNRAKRHSAKIEALDLASLNQVQSEMRQLDQLPVETDREAQSQPNIQFEPIIMPKQQKQEVGVFQKIKRWFVS